MAAIEDRERCRGGDGFVQGESGEGSWSLDGDCELLSTYVRGEWGLMGSAYAFFAAIAALPFVRAS